MSARASRTAFRVLWVLLLCGAAVAAAMTSNTEVRLSAMAAVILLVAIVAAIVLTMRKRPGLKAQNIRKQVQVRREDRVRLVSMDADKQP